MKKIVGVGFALILCGCASVEMAQYTVTSFAEVPLKNKAKIKIVANGNGLDSIVGSVKDTFKKGGKFSVVDSDADYWFVLSGASQYVVVSGAATLTKEVGASTGTVTFAGGNGASIINDASNWKSYGDVPEPTSGLLLLMGVGLLGLRRKQK